MCSPPWSLARARSQHNPDMTVSWQPALAAGLLVLGVAVVVLLKLTGCSLCLPAQGYTKAVQQPVRMSDLGDAENGGRGGGEESDQGAEGDDEDDDLIGEGKV